MAPPRASFCPICGTKQQVAFSYETRCINSQCTWGLFTDPACPQHARMVTMYDVNFLKAQRIDAEQREDIEQVRQAEETKWSNRAKRWRDDANDDGA